MNKRCIQVALAGFCIGLGTTLITMAIYFEMKYLGNWEIVALFIGR